MNAFAVAERNAQLDNFATRGVFASLHTAFPGDTGASEVAGGSPAYARKAITWNAAAAAAVTAATQPSFDVPAATTIKWLGFWTLAVGGTFRGSAPLGSALAVPFVVRDAVVADTFQADNHGFTDGLKVVLFDTDVGVLPTGVTEGTDYFVVSAATDSFQLSLTSGGAAITLTTDGAGFASLITPETFGAQGVYATTAVSLSYTR